jgi:hypothetical protein
MKALGLLKSGYNPWFSSLGFCRKLRRMCVPTASSELLFDTARRLPAANRAPADRPLPAKLTVAEVGYLAPAMNFDAIVHSVFAHACNVEGPCGLLTIAAHALDDGPTVWRLAAHDRPDFRDLFRCGERLRRRYAAATAPEVVLDLSRANTWRPAAWPFRASRAVATNLQIASAALERRRTVSRSVIDGDAGPWLRSLEEGCRRLDVSHATAAIDRLVGWGEGLTPAGDDAIVGVLAAARALAGPDSKRIAFVDALSAAVGARAGRTADISAHYLRLAAQGHFNADVRCLVHALMGADGASGVGAGVPVALAAPLHDALAAALDVGGTSGADMVAGMMAGFRALCPATE